MEVELALILGVPSTRLEFLYVREEMYEDSSARSTFELNRSCHCRVFSLFWT